MLIGQLLRVVVFVAVNAAENLKIARSGVAIHTFVPFPLVFSAVNRERPIVIEVGRCPCRFRVAALTIGRELRGGVVGAHRLVIVTGVASKAGIGRIVVISIVAGRAVIRNRHVGASDGINIIVVKGRRYPGRFRVTRLTVRRELRTGVVRIGGLPVIILMAAKTGVRRVVVIPVMAGGAIIRNGRMFSVKGVVIIVDAERSRIPSRLGSVAGSAIGWQP